MTSLQPSRLDRTDALSRRLRFAPPTPQVRRLILTEADYQIFEAINRHGPLPTGYLFEFTKHLRRDYSHLQNRLTEFYNGDVTGGKGGPYLTRPPQQFANFEARYQPIVYGLAPRARVALAERGTLSRFSTRGSDPFVHQLMCACVGASFERAATDADIRYIPREEILARQDRTGFNSVVKALAIPISGMSQKTLIPDDLFGLNYSEGGFRFFAVEIDRSTESIERRNGVTGSYGAKVSGYDQILARQLYKEWWGVPNLTVLTVTTNPIHAANLLNYVRQQSQHTERFAFATVPSFSADWRVPRQLLSHLLSSPWKTTGGNKQIGTP